MCEQPFPAARDILEDRDGHAGPGFATKDGAASCRDIARFCAWLPGHTDWMLGNVNNPTDGVTPLNWWRN